MKYFDILAVSIVFTLACPSGSDYCHDARCGDGFGDYVDPVVSILGGAVDDQLNSFYASNNSHRYANLFNKLSPVGEAWAAACTRPSSALCINEVRTGTYSVCSIDATPYVLDGTITLTYSGTPNCGFSSVGDSVTRALNVTRTINNNGVVTTSSDASVDRRGITIGGGTRITIDGTTDFGLDILGIHKTLVQNSVKMYDLLLRTTSTISVSGGLARTGRVLNGGTLEVVTSNNQYNFVPDNLAYDAGCCYPVSGSLHYSESGAFTGTGTISFTSCGFATIQWNGDSSPYEMQLVSCE